MGIEEDNTDPAQVLLFKPFGAPLGTTPGAPLGAPLGMGPLFGGGPEGRLRK